MKQIKIFLIIGFLAAFRFVQAQNSSDQDACWLGVDSTINLYADSLNFLQHDKLPNFLEDHLMDWKLRRSLFHCTAREDEAISYRYAILQRVTNEKALNAIIISTNAFYDKIYDPINLKKEIGQYYYNDFPTLPFMKYSIRTLAKQRVDQITRIKSKINRR